MRLLNRLHPLPSPFSAAVIEHLGMWTTATVSVLHDGEGAVYLVVVTARPVRVQAAADIAATMPFYVPKSFKRLG